MGLFGGLPAPKRPLEDASDSWRRNKEPRIEAPATATATATGGALPEPSAADLEDLNEGEEKAAAAGGEALAGGAAAVEAPSQEAEDVDVPPPPPPSTAPAGGGDQVSAALRKIAGHIGHPKKFAKASQLLRELLAQDAITARHGPLLFSALKAAMANPGQAAEPPLAREYSKLFTAASKVAEVFSVREKNQLEVFGTWAVLRNQLATDDSFQFNRVVTRLKEMAAELPEATEEDEAAAARLVAAASAPDPVLAAFDKQQAEAAAPTPAPAPASLPTVHAEDAEVDPFGLDAIMEQQDAVEAATAAAAAPLKQPKSVTWSSGEVACQRRAVLLDCLDSAKACYRHMWARTSVDLLIEHCHSHKDRFLPSQRGRIEVLMGFVRDQRRIRKLGPSAKEVNRDSTAFERARAEWSKADVSHRGKVGAAGDRGAEQWLGGG